VNITNPIHRRARSSPRSTAIVRVDGRSVSYRDLDRTIDNVALRARSLALTPGACTGARPVAARPRDHHRPRARLVVIPDFGHVHALEESTATTRAMIGRLQI